MPRKLCKNTTKIQDLYGVCHRLHTHSSVAPHSSKEHSYYNDALSGLSALNSQSFLSQ